MQYAIYYFIVLFLILFSIGMVSDLWKGQLAKIAVLITIIISSLPALAAISGQNFHYILTGNELTGKIPICIDPLSAWFILIINFTFLTGIIYGAEYLKAYKNQSANLSLHYISFILIQVSLLAICMVQNTFVFLVIWEIMALASFITIILDHQKEHTLRSGINFLIQSHVCILLLLVGFAWVASGTDTFDFAGITKFSGGLNESSKFLLFFCFFCGFAIKAGFVPFHTWLPYAHPAAPAHISGVMSGVIIKIGIYGLLRVILLLQINDEMIGYFILIISIISGVYGVMLAIVQHDLKKLLAYHSIENIGIIGIGIGLGCIGKGNGNTELAYLGFMGAMLHTLNHSLFKSALFYAAGNVYQATHTVNIDSLGGLIRRMPYTSIGFLIAAMAICGLPPFNGFISEYLIYSGLFKGLQGNGIWYLCYLAISIFGLALIGGLAFMCFTKAFGIVFLGNPRQALPKETHEAAFSKLLPVFLCIALILTIGLFPQLFMKMLNAPVGLFVTSHAEKMPQISGQLAQNLGSISIACLAFLALISIIWWIRNRNMADKTIAEGPTWGCGYVGGDSKLQYTASSYVRTYRKLAEPVLFIQKKKKVISGIFPKEGSHHTHAYDLSEKWFIDFPLKLVHKIFNRFAFLQNGNPQSYVLYGVGFIAIIILLPVMVFSIKSILHFFMQM